MPDNTSLYYPLTGLSIYLNIIPHHCINLKTKINFVACDLSQADRASLLDVINAVRALNAFQCWHNLCEDTTSSDKGT